ncbi:hypothetical protein PG985_006797 [Apiospora marii]|uniref:RING-type domain-containing protein n=1 Tax=Apiospora marii TaxID=335849 RepID=A0ABR1SFX4_9PEZI
MPDNVLLRETCLICHQERPLSELVALGCSHVYHPECITKWWEISPPKACPYCKKGARSFGHACGQPGACTASPVSDEATTFLPGPLPVCLPCGACGQLQRLLEANRAMELRNSIHSNQTSLRSLLSSYDGTDPSDYDQWQTRDRQEMEEKGQFYYCQRGRSSTSAVDKPLPDNGRRVSVYREPQPETTDASSYQHHLRHLGRITRAELAYACDTQDMLHLSVAVASRGGGAAYTQWQQSELQNLQTRRRALDRFEDEPMRKAPALYFDWLFAFERLWYRTRAIDLEWEMMVVDQTETPQEEEDEEDDDDDEKEKKKNELKLELGNLADEYSWRMACLVHVRDEINQEAI